jgi:TetR/AcrR family transcriptional regulator, tetracycline repressor protein
MNDEQRAKHLARLEAMQRRSEERLEQQRERLNKRFESIRARFIDEDEAPNDAQQRIIAAALELLDEEGLNELSLRKIAKKLGVQAPAIYWHFKNKELLIDYMAEAMLQTEFANLKARDDNTPWQDWLVDMCKRLRIAMASHRDGARIIAGAHLFPAETLLRLFEVCQQSLVEAGVDEERADLVVSTAVHYTFGRVIEEQSSPSEEEMRQIDIGEFLKSAPYLARSTMRSIEALNNGHDEFDDALRLIIGYA